ncbi:MAG: signal peptidase II [Myxococcota bacterium]
MQESEAPRRSLSSIILCLVALSALTGLDLWSKQWAEEHLSRSRPVGNAPDVCDPEDRRFQRLPDGSLSLIEGHFELRYAENCGAAFGLLNTANVVVRSLVFGIAGVVAISALLWMFWMGRGGICFALSVPCIVSGALGNLWDRASRGYVIDFIRAYDLPGYRSSWDYPTFNVADIAITVGVALMFIASFREDASREDGAATSGDSLSSGEALEDKEASRGNA